MSTVYDSKKAQTLINSAAAYRMHPGAGLIQQLSDMLKAADESLLAVGSIERKAKIDIERANRERDQEIQNAAAFRQQLAHLPRFTEALTKIAAGAKGAKGIALTALKEAGIEVAAPANSNPSPANPPA